MYVGTCYTHVLCTQHQLMRRFQTFNNVVRVFTFNVFKYFVYEYTEIECIKIKIYNHFVIDTQIYLNSVRPILIVLYVYIF